jgi:predicted DsbA family dithiol-disulfide isomerase
LEVDQVSTFEAEKSTSSPSGEAPRRSLHAAFERGEDAIRKLLLAGRLSFTVEGLIDVARQLVLDPGEAEAALRDRTFREPVEEDIAEGERAGVHGTPTFFIDGVRLAGHWRQLAEAIPDAMAKA